MRNNVPTFEVTEEWKKAAGLLASKKCKKCYGRGYQERSLNSLPREVSGNVFALCNCTRKKK